ncbi:MAG: 2-octaprenyl-6-methoxyphenyl hydroxylase [Rhodospirillaceae bacterium]|nr:2-octaprenyl-6-methoxyphenyl hydroxylase [Rhodospirillaceae bacterium]HAA93617.1 2-octaprenyl-6-methoxyphenyl hydroxylase [Rhodospirillaceae bacterium]
MSESAKSRKDVIIVGGGMAGMSLGLALSAGGLRTLVIDSLAPETETASDYDGRASAIAHGSANILKGIGLWSNLESDASPIWDIRVADGHPLRGISPLFLHYDHGDVGDDPFGYIIENRAIRKALQDAAGESENLELVRPATVVSVEREPFGVSVFTETGQQFDGSVLVAADGRGSQIRQDAGIQTTVAMYRQKSIVCTVRHERDHAGTAVELFMPSGPFAMLPMTENRSNVVWTERIDLADRYLALDDDAFLQELGQRFGRWLGEIELAGPRFGFPLGVLHASRYTDQRLVLLGDAAHAIHPIAGQGLNLGLRDAAALAELFVDAARLGLDIGAASVLGRYERWRRFDNMVLTAVTDGLNRLFSNDIPPVRVARDLGLAMVDRLPPIKKFLMRHAMGHVGELPRLVRGKSL